MGFGRDAAEDFPAPIELVNWPARNLPTLIIYFFGPAVLVNIIQNHGFGIRKSFRWNAAIAFTLKDMAIIHNSNDAWVFEVEHSQSDNFVGGGFENAFEFN